MVENVNKKGVVSPNALIVLLIIIVIGILSVVAIFIVTQKPFKASATQISEKTSDFINLSKGNLSMGDLEASPMPTDECGNSMGLSKQAHNFSRINYTTGVPFYPKYFDCIGEDCCRDFVYMHVLNFQGLIKDKFVYLDFYLSRDFVVNKSEFARACVPDSLCCTELGANYLGTDGDLVECAYGPTNAGNPYTLLFYYSDTGRPTDWVKIYDITYNSGGRKTILLPIADKFKFVRIMAVNNPSLGADIGFIPYIRGQIIPWQYKANRYYDVCMNYSPARDTGSENFLYDDTGEELDELKYLYKNARGYIVNISANSSGLGLWKK